MGDIPSATEFVGYVGGANLHDAVIIRVEAIGENLRIQLRSSTGKEISVTFFGISDFVSNSPEGMSLYGLVERKEAPGLRRFVFVNWQDEDTACLEVTAEGYTVKEN